MASPSLTDSTIDAMLASARRNNSLPGLTGLLIFDGGNFLQILEGVVPAIDELMAQLRLDWRHSNISIRDTDDRSASLPEPGNDYLRVDENRFVGAEQVRRTLERDLSPSLRNMLRVLVHSVMERASGAASPDQAMTRPSSGS